jgi:hypothetical protein
MSSLYVQTVLQTDHKSVSYIGPFDFPSIEHHSPKNLTDKKAALCTASSRQYIAQDNAVQVIQAERFGEHAEPFFYSGSTVAMTVKKFNGKIGRMK